MKDPIIISSEFEYLNDIINKVESDREWLKKVVCFMLYYNNPKSGRLTRTGIKRAILEIFRADAHKQRDWIRNAYTREKYPMLTFDEAELFLNEERFREYDVKALKIVNTKYNIKLVS